MGQLVKLGLAALGFGQKDVRAVLGKAASNAEAKPDPRGSQRPAASTSVAAYPGTNLITVGQLCFFATNWRNPLLTLLSRAVISKDEFDISASHMDSVST